MKLLVGGDSELGAATLGYMKRQGRIALATTRRRNLASPERPYFDILDISDAWTAPEGVDAACIFVSIARLRDCAVDPVRSARINVDQTLRLIDKLTAQGVYTVFLSSNQVFDGKTAAVAAATLACPVSEYGRQKAATEAAILERIAKGAALAILRLSKVISPSAPLIAGWIDTLRQGRPIQAFNDMMLAPVPVGQVAAAIETLLENKPVGVFQLSGPRDVSYYEIGQYIAGTIGADPVLVQSLKAGSSGMPEGSTPDNTTLDSRFFEMQFGDAVPDAFRVIDDIIKLKSTQPMTQISDAKTVSLDDLIEATEGVYYSKFPVPLVDGKLVDFLKGVAASSTLKRARFCAHPAPDSEQHDMLIATHSASYVAPHRHMSKSEAFTLLEGACEMILFDENGMVEDVVEMGPPGSGRPFFYRMPEKRFHSLRPLTDVLVFLENTKGPFNLDDREYALWAPDYRDAQGGTAYIATVLADWRKLQSGEESPERGGTGRRP